MIHGAPEDYDSAGPIMNQLRTVELRDASPKYNVLVVSPIPVHEIDGEYFTMDLWERDISTQARLAAVQLVCPLSIGKPVYSVAKLDTQIGCHDWSKLTDDKISDLVSTVDVIQLPGNAGWVESALTRRVLRIARRFDKVVILGVSSNRAKTALLNSSNFVLGALKYFDVRSCQMVLAARSTGVFVVGNSLREIFRRSNPNLHVSIASWIKESEIVVHRESRASGTLNICMASRIEKMKGMHIGVAAVNTARHAMPGVGLCLTIVGDGPEKRVIEEQVIKLGLAPFTGFQSTIPYPRSFFDFLGQMDLALLTNLNDEQPRLIFDALSQGCLPICPDTAAYRGLGLSKALFYKRGSSSDLSRAIRGLADSDVRNSVRDQMLGVTRKFTIDTMHEQRSAWVASFLKK